MYVYDFSMPYLWILWRAYYILWQWQIMVVENVAGFSKTNKILIVILTANLFMKFSWNKTFSGYRTEHLPDGITIRTESLKPLHWVIQTSFRTEPLPLLGRNIMPSKWVIEAIEGRLIRNFSHVCHLWPYILALLIFVCDYKSSFLYEYNNFRSRSFF